MGPGHSAAAAPSSSPDAIEAAVIADAEVCVGLDLVTSVQRLLTERGPRGQALRVAGCDLGRGLGPQRFDGPGRLLDRRFGRLGDRQVGHDRSLRAPLELDLRSRWCLGCAIPVTTL